MIMKREAYKVVVARCPKCNENIWLHHKEDGDTYRDEHVCLKD